MIKNIVFDMGNVLLDYNPAEYVKNVIDDEAAASAVLKELFYGPEWTMLDGGQITDDEAVRRVTQRIPQYSPYVEFVMDKWHNLMKPMEGMPDLVEELKDRNYKIYLLSNASLRFYKYYENYDMFRYFDGFLISAKERLLKPDPAIYRRLLDKFGLNSNECLFIDDLPQNVEGAKKVGFHAYLFRGPDKLRSYLKEESII